MRITLRNADGSEELREVASLVLNLDEWQLEVTKESLPLHVHLCVPGLEQSFCSFVVHHRCANTMTVELRPMVRDGSSGQG